MLNSNEGVRGAWIARLGDRGFGDLVGRPLGNRGLLVCLEGCVIVGLWM